MKGEVACTMVAAKSYMKEDKSLINKLLRILRRQGAPIVVGLDPMLNYAGACAEKRHLQNMERHWKGVAEAIWQFNKEIVDKTCDLIPAVKPQIAIV